MIIARYERICTMGHSYLKVPVTDMQAVLGFDRTDDEDEILGFCPVQGDWIYLEENEAMPLFVQRAQQQGWDVDWVDVDRRCFREPVEEESL